MEPRTRFNLIYFALAVVAMLLVQQWWQTAQTVEVVPFPEKWRLLGGQRLCGFVAPIAKISS